VDAARRQLLALATEADRGEDRAAWLAIMAGAELCAAALEPLTDLSAAHAVNAARYVLDAMTWPDDDPAQRAQAEARLLELLARHRDAHPKP
jgi:crotonobetainyl-CoA:carnitine CoA-transferase CaiB-like acyl-CoA transferase